MTVTDQNHIILYLSLYFNKDYATIVSKKIITLVVDSYIEFQYDNLNYVEFNNLISNVKVHKYFLTYYKYIKENNSYTTVIKFRVDKNKKRLLTLVNNNRLHMLTFLVEDHYRSFCKNCNYIPITFSKVNSLLKKQLI